MRDSGPRLCFVETTTDGETYVAVFDKDRTGAIDHYCIDPVDPPIMTDDFPGI
jgi:hypothetical protein